jgi:phosphoglycolate phosphatase-like HAD superfamily hydrolase
MPPRLFTGRNTLAATLLMFVLGIDSTFHSCHIPEKTTDSISGLSASALGLWADSPRSRIITWVNDVTDSGSSNFIPVHDRIAVFDNDGTLWVEQPLYTEIQFSIDYIQVMGSRHPDWMKDPLLSAVIRGDMEGVKKSGMKGIEKIFVVSHTGQTEEEFSAAVSNWIDTARHKKFNRLYKDLVYAPMLELLEYLRKSGFKTFIVSGGSADFMRPWAQGVYGIPPYRVVGSYTSAQFDIQNGNPAVTITPGEFFLDDAAGKPVGIHRFIGKVPVFCAGNSDGDQAMLEYTAGGKYKSLCLLIHHTDDVREFQYDSLSMVGRLRTALDEARAKGWMVVDMKNDFKKVFAFQ